METLKYLILKIKGIAGYHKGDVTIHAHKIEHYCYRHHYFTVCALQVICFIVYSIKSTIVGNRELIAVVCFQ